MSSYVLICTKNTPSSMSVIPRVQVSVLRIIQEGSNTLKSIDMTLNSKEAEERRMLKALQRNMGVGCRGGSVG